MKRCTFSFLLFGVILYISWMMIHLPAKSEFNVNTMLPPFSENSKVDSHIKQRMAERSSRMREVCQREPIISSANALKARKTAWKMTEVLEEHRLMVCVVHKAGSSTWNTITALRYHRGDLIDRKMGHKMISVLNPKWTRYKYILQSPTFVKVVMARNPFERVLSAFRDRIVRPGLKNSDQIKFYALPSINYNRDNKLSASDIFHNNGTLKIFPTFSEFISYLMTISPREYDPHFIPVSIQCGVCHVDYNAVLLTETFSEDLQYIMKMGNLDEEVDPSLALKHVNQANVDTRQLLGFYYSTVRPDVLQKFIETYRLDFELFNYDSNMIFDYISYSKTNKTSV